MPRLTKWTACCASRAVRRCRARSVRRCAHGPSCAECAGSTAAELQAWDGQISDLLFAVSQSVESVHRAFPDNPALRELQ